MTVWAALGARLDDLRATGRWPSGATTVLEIIGHTRLEAAHEKITAWLLDPLANHGLGPRILASLINHLHDGRLPSPEELSRVHVRTQVVGARGRPDIVVTMAGAYLVIELKIDAKEGTTQTSRQADDYADVPDVSFAFLTLDASPPTDPRFKHVLLRDFYGFLCFALENSKPASSRAHVRGRAVAEDYAATLERMLGVDPVDQEAARYWFRYENEIRIAETAAQRLLNCLHEYVARAFQDLAVSLGDDVLVVTRTYHAEARWNTSYEERAVLLTREAWMRAQEGPQLGVGFGMSTQPKADWTVYGAYRPFWGVYTDGSEITKLLRVHLSHIQDQLAEGGEQWGPWVRWWHVDLEPPDGQGDLLVHYASSIANRVSQFWGRHIDILDRALRSTIEGS